MKKLILLSIALMLALLPVKGQVYKYRWTATYNKSGASVIGGSRQYGVFYLCFSGNSFYIGDANGNRDRDFGYSNKWVAGGTGYGQPVNPLDWVYKGKDDNGNLLYVNNRSLLNNQGRVFDYLHDTARFSSDMKKVNVYIDSRFVSGGFSTVPFTVYPAGGFVIVLELVEDALNNGEMY